MMKYIDIYCYFFKISLIFIIFNLIQLNANNNPNRFLYTFLPDSVKNHLHIDDSQHSKRYI